MDNTDLQIKILEYIFSNQLAFLLLNSNKKAIFSYYIQIFRKFMTKLKLNKTGCLYVVFMLKLTNKLNVLHWMPFTFKYKCKLKVRSFLIKKNIKRNLLSRKGPPFFVLIFKSHETEVNFLIAIFLLNTNIKVIFFQSRPKSLKCYVKSLKRIIYVDIFR